MQPPLSSSLYCSYIPELGPSSISGAVLLHATRIPRSLFEFETIQVDCFCPNLIFKIFKIVSGEEGEHFCLDTNIFLDESLNEEDIDFEVLLLIREEESSVE